MIFLKNQLVQFGPESLVHYTPESVVQFGPEYSVRNHPRKLPQETVDKILELRRTYNLGSKRITWYLERYHGIKTSESSVCRTLLRHNERRLPSTASKRTLQTKRYTKKVPGHHVQMDVKSVSLDDSNGKKKRRFQYTAIDVATRIRAIRIYKKHNQQNAIDFANYVIDKFPFRIHKIRTDQEEFYQLLSYTDDVDLSKKLKHWKHFYNFNRPHGTFEGKTPYERLKHLLK